MEIWILPQNLMNRNQLLNSIQKLLCKTLDNINSERTSFLTKGATVMVMASQYDFIFCKYNSEEKNISGWIYYKDISNSE